MDNTRKIEQLKSIVDRSRYLVCICEKGMQRELGYRDMMDSDAAYDIERKYGHATEEIFNSAFYATRKEQFFEFYKNEVLSAEQSPGEGFQTLCKLEEAGKLRAIITTGIYSLPQRAGCKNVIELHGNINNNECPHCHKKYDVDFIRRASRVPHCTQCNTVIRPGVYLFGEMLDNGVMTRAMEEIERADVLMICGSGMEGLTTSNCIQYFNGDKVVLINEEPHYSDGRADLVIYAEIKHVLAQLVE